MIIKSIFFKILLLFQQKVIWYTLTYFIESSYQMQAI